MSIIRIHIEAEPRQMRVRNANGEREVVEDMTYSQWSDWISDTQKAKNTAGGGKIISFNDTKPQNVINISEIVGETAKAVNYTSSGSLNTASVGGIILPTAEYAHVMSEISTHITNRQKKEKIFRKAVGRYIYTVENIGGNDFRILKKELIDDD